MTREIYEDIISKLQAAGINEWHIRCEGGTKLFYHNHRTELIFPKDDYVVCVALSRNHLTQKQAWVIGYATWDDVFEVIADDVPITNMLNIVKNNGDYNEEFEEFVKQSPAKITITPGPANVGRILDENDKPVIDSPLPGYVTH